MVLYINVSVYTLVTVISNLLALWQVHGLQRVKQTFCYDYPEWSQENLDKGVSFEKEENVFIRTVGYLLVVSAYRL